VPKLPGREPTFVTYRLEQLLVDYWLGPHHAGQVHRCVGCGLVSTRWPDDIANWGAVVVLEADPRVRVGTLCPACTQRLEAIYSDPTDADV
jgi:hypothetical protein